MEKQLKGTKTEANLLAAFAGESQARNKYTYYASKAKKEGYVSPPCLKRPRTTKRNTRRSGSSSCTKATSRRRK